MKNSKKTKLIAKLKKELYSKKEPSEVLNKITFDKLKALCKGYKYDYDALWIGSYLADLFIGDALKRGNLKLHIPMALKYARELIKEYKIDKKQKEIILEIIKTHHGGKQKFIESKLYKNADCFKFLEPIGVFDLISTFYKKTENSMKEAIKYATYKIDEKYKLVDLNNKVKNEAEELYLMWMSVFKRIRFT